MRRPFLSILLFLACTTVQAESSAAPSVSVQPFHYHKTDLAGKFQPEPRPDLSERSDREPEKTFVDPLALRLFHASTDLYIPVADGNLALSIRRNCRAEAWSDDSDLPARAFGRGWSSSLDAHLAIRVKQDGKITMITARDEDGTDHRFASRPTVGSFVRAMPSAETHQESAAVTLEKEESGRYISRRKFGTVLTYEAKPQTVVQGKLDEVRFHRLISVSDAFGTEIKYEYLPENTTLIPDALLFLSQKIKVSRNAEGLVSEVMEPTGEFRRYEYSIGESGSRTLSKLIGPDCDRRPVVTTYEYWEAGSENSRCLAVSSIRDPNGNSFGFGYLSSTADQPPLLHRIELPGKSGVARFHRFPASDKGQAVFVENAAGHGALIEFSEPVPIQLGGVNLIGYGAEKVTFFERMKGWPALRYRPFFPGKFFKELNSQEYRFAANTSFALSEARDNWGNSTHFQYWDKWPDTADADTAMRHRKDVTQTIEPSGYKRSIEYHPVYRTIVRKVDELGRIRLFEFGAKYPHLLSEQLFESEARLEKGEPFSRTLYRYDDARFPCFNTEKRICKLGDKGPSWETDLLTRYEADHLCRLAREITDPEGLKIILAKTYDESSKVISTVNDGTKRRFFYDAKNQIVRIEEPGSSPADVQVVKESIYDARGQAVMLKTSGQRTIFPKYNALGHIISETFDENNNDRLDADIDSKRAYKYDVFGLVTVGFADNGEPLTRQFDGMGRIRRAWVGKYGMFEYRFEANSGSFLFADSVFQMTTMSMSAGIATYTRDSSARVGHQSSSDGSVPLESFVYDAVGNLLESDSRGRGITVRIYDAENRLLSEIGPEGKRRTYYTSTGLIYAEINGSEKKVYKYDAAGRKVTDPK